MKYQDWKILSVSPVLPPALQQAGYPPLLAAVLGLRGIDNPLDARDFLAGSIQLEDPMAMADMPKAAARVRSAISAGEHVAVYGDYDVDGITSACLLTDYLRGKGLTCELYIPDRMEEGYGVNAGAIRTLAERGVTLIITVDCGVTAIEEAALAAQLGVDMVITDHHECRETLPGAVAVVDPKRPDCTYPFDGLAGVGVAFKLVSAVEGDALRTLARYGDLVAVGTIADVMSLTGENRVIIRAGLEKLSRSPRPGLRALIDASLSAGKHLTATTIGFTLAPRINAAGRLGKVEVAVELLMTRDAARCQALAEALCSLNRERQALEAAIWEEAQALLQAEPPETPIVLASDHWHQGVIGIAASRLSEAFHLPSVMICLDGEKGKGSCRSFGDFNLFDALSACADCLEGFGGHAMAAGLSIRRSAIPAFREMLGAYYRQHHPDTSARLLVDLQIPSPDFLTMDCVEGLELLEPCGNGNPRPLFCLRHTALETVTPIGGGKHLRLRIRKFGRPYECVFFGCTQAELGLRPGDEADIVFFPQINEFRARRSVQLLVTDIKTSE